ncbi:tRNA (adenosine(37)-N6)-threonylcarbamoyltransferase complex transferase subunit TsaD [Candidatus Micrarchaeota archaeon]|nr:tRNA (adenosine(37)-N6)-threonylcarbamoyltransferase complex transferase subunit TsaD [Candidatus Micrarchaeota archaeon]
MILGIESTAHTLGMGIVHKGKVLSNIGDTYKPKNEGIIPRKAADHHAEKFAELLRANLHKAGVRMEDVDAIAYSEGPGLGACLKVGLVGAKYLALKYGKKMIGVNHPYAHIKIAEGISGVRNPLILYVSGGNTQLLIEKEGKFRVLGETLDMGVGNLFDAFGREIGMEYAHGAELAKLAEGGKYVPLPYVVKGMNLSFSGLLTHAAKEVNKGNKKDVAYSLFETSFAMLCEVTERALFLTRRKGVIVCGGVAQNKRLQGMLRSMCKEDGVKFGVAPDEFNRDNGAMIAYAGELIMKKGMRAPEKCGVDQDYRVDKLRLH